MHRFGGHHHEGQRYEGSPQKPEQNMPEYHEQKAPKADEVYVVEESKQFTLGKTVLDASKSGDAIFLQ